MIHLRPAREADDAFFQEMEFRTTWQSLSPADQERLTPEHLRAALALTHELLLNRPGNQVVIAQALVRQAYVEARDDAVLHALGMPRRDLYVLAAARGAFTGVTAAVLAVVVAALISPLMPIGIARTAELNPGLEVDPAVCALGVLAVVLVVVALRVLAAYRVTRATARGSRFPRRTPVAVRLLDRVTLPPTADAGVRFALDPGRRTPLSFAASTHTSTVVPCGSTAGLIVVTLATIGAPSGPMMRASAPEVSSAASFRSMCTRATTFDVLITVTTGLPGATVSPA